MLRTAELNVLYGFKAEGRTRDVWLGGPARHTSSAAELI